MPRREPLPPRQYAAQVLGKAVTPEQLEELFRLHAAAHPVVEHLVLAEVELAGILWHNVRSTRVQILSHHPSFSFSGPPAAVLAQGRSRCSPNDQWSRRLGVTIAFGRALKQLRADVRAQGAY